jgi:hypothetical protein
MALRQNDTQPAEHFMLGQPAAHNHGFMLTPPYGSGSVASSDASPVGASPTALELPRATVNTQHAYGRGKPARSPCDDDEQRFVDEFGFDLNEEAAQLETNFVRNIDGVQVQRREVKWTHMASEWNGTLKKNSEKLKERARKGIPSRMRGVVWQLLSQSRLQMEAPENHSVFMQLMKKKIPSDTEGLIERDLARTFPNHALFKDTSGAGQTSLRNILHAYAVIDPEVGYVQGMGFIVGTLLTQMTEEEAFWCFHSMMHSEVYRLRELYRPGFPMLQMFFYQLKRLIKRQVPKVSAHLEDLGVDMSFFAAQWFLTIFVYHFSFRAVLRVWDIFFCEGWKIVFRVAICLLKWEEQELLALPFDVLLPRMKTLPEGKPCDELISRALKVKFKTEELLEFRLEYESGELK